MALVATRPFSLYEQDLGPGDHIRPEVVERLPRGRMETLKRAGHVVETHEPARRSAPRKREAA